MIDEATQIDDKLRLIHTLVNQGGIDQDLRGADLNKVNLNQLDLSHANLCEAQVLSTNFTDAVLTGACIANWQISSSTIFDRVQCDYIFRGYDYGNQVFTDRLPVSPNKTFEPGEFEKWIAVRKGALDTIDITFTEGIDWHAFFQSLQTVRQQHPDANVAMKAVEEERGIFVARLKLETELTGDERESLKASVETEIKASYALQLAEARGEIKALERSLDRSERSLDKAVEKLAMTSSQNFYGTVGNVAGTNHGQMTATIHNNYGSKADEIVQLLNSLRDTAQAFPKEQIEEVHIHLDDLANDLQQEKPQPARLRTRMVALLTLAIALGTHVATATDFANNVLELSQKLSVPIQALEPQLQQLKQIHPGFEWTPTE